MLTIALLLPMLSGCATVETACNDDHCTLAEAGLDQTFASFAEVVHEFDPPVALDRLEVGENWIAWETGPGRWTFWSLANGTSVTHALTQQGHVFPLVISGNQVAYAIHGDGEGAHVVVADIATGNPSRRIDLDLRRLIDFSEETLLLQNLTLPTSYWLEPAGCGECPSRLIDAGALGAPGGEIGECNLARGHVACSLHTPDGWQLVAYEPRTGALSGLLSSDARIDEFLVTREWAFIANATGIYAWEYDALVRRDWVRDDSFLDLTRKDGTFAYAVAGGPWLVVATQNTAQHVGELVRFYKAEGACGTWMARELDDRRVILWDIHGDRMDAFVVEGDLVSTMFSLDLATYHFEACFGSGVRN